MVESSDEMWSTGEGNDKTPQYSCLENHMKCMKRKKKNMTLKDEFPRSVVSKVLLEISVEITPERMKRSQSKNNTA